MSLQFSTTHDQISVNGVKVMVYGGPGMGKTVLSATMPTPLIISNESGLLSLSRSNLERIYGVNAPGVTYDSIPVILINDIQSFDEAYRFCKDSAEARQFQSICLDSISEMAESVLNSLKRSVKDPRQAYGELIEKMETNVRKFRDLPGKNVYISAKEGYSRDEISGITRYGPSMPGAKLGPSLPFFFDEVFRLAVNRDSQGNTYRYLSTQPDLQFEAKDRSGALAPIEYPHLGMVIQKILGGQNADKVPV